MDNTQLQSGGGGDTIRTLDKTGTGAPKTEVVALDLGGGDGRSEFISSFPLPIATDSPVDDDNIPLLSLSPSSMDALEMLFRQTIAAVSAPYVRTAAEITAGVTPTNLAFPPGDVRRYGAVGDGITDDALAFAAAALVSGTYPIQLLHQTYLVNTPFVLPSGGSIFTDSRNSVIKTTVAGNHIVSAVNQSNITLYSVTFQGANSYTNPTSIIGGQQTNTTALATFVNCTNVRIYDCEFSQFCNGITCINCSKVFITHNYIHNWLIYAILGSGSTECAFDFNIMDTCDLSAIPTFTGALSPGATSATISAVAPSAAWQYATGVYGVLFLESAGGGVVVRGVTLTNGATTATWSPALPNACIAQTDGSSYGISITGSESTGAPANGVSISYNRIRNVPAWDGIMSHDVNGLAAIGNDIKNVRTGIDFGMPVVNKFIRNIRCVGNYIEATTQDPWNGVAASASGILLNGATQSITFTGAPAATATSATLNANWTNQTGAYTVQFTETVSGQYELRQVTLTNGATTATWGVGLTVNCNAGATANFGVDAATLSGNTIRNYGNMVATGTYGAPNVINSGAITAGYVNDLTATGNIIEGVGTSGGYVGLYLFGILNNGTITGNIIGGNMPSGAIRSVGLVALNLTIDGNIINQTVLSNIGIRIGNTSQVAQLFLGTNPTNSTTPSFNEGSTLTLTANNIPVIESYVQSSFIVPTGNFALLSKNLHMGTASRATLQGTARLRIN